MGRFPRPVTASSHDVTALLHAWTAGDSAARDQLMAVVYQELRRPGGRAAAPRTPRAHAAADGARARGVPAAGRSAADACGRTAGSSSASRAR